MATPRWMKGNAVKVDVQDAGGCKRTLHIELSDEEVRAEMGRIVKEFRRKTQLPGFRKGKVPTTLVESQFGDYIERELLDRLIPKAYREALEQEKLEPIAQGEIRDFNYTKGQPLSFVADLEVRPAVALGDLGGVKVVKRVYEVENAEIDEMLGVLRTQQATFEVVSRASQPGDRVTVTLADLSENPEAEGEETGIELGSEGLLPEFDRALTGAEAGSTHEIEVTYPDDMPNESLRGQTRRFRASVKEIAEKKVPDLDDNLAKELGFDDLDELRSRIRLRLEGEEELRAQREAEDTLVRQLVERNPFDAPEVMVDNLLSQLIEDVEVPDERRDAFKEAQRPGAELTVKRMLLLDAAAREHEIGVTDEEVETAIRDSVEDDERQAARAVKEARDSGAFDRYRHRLRERKVFEFLMDAIEVEEVTAKRPTPPNVATAGKE